MAGGASGLEELVELRVNAGNDCGQSKWGASHKLVEVHHRHLRVGVVGSLSEKCPRGQLVKSPTEHASAGWLPGRPLAT